MGGNCLTAALMLFQESHPSSKLGDVPLKTPCIIFLMMSPPKQSQKIIQSYRRPWVEWGVSQTYLLNISRFRITVIAFCIKMITTEVNEHAIGCMGQIHVAP